MIRNFLRSWIPVWLHRVIQERRVSFSGTYKNFDTINVNNSNVTYHNSESLSFDRQRMLATKDDLVKLTQPNNYRPNYHSRYTILSLIVSSLSLEYVQVLDIGGGSGYGFPYIKWACPNKRIKFNIVDLPTVCELGRKVLGNIDGLSYSNVPNLKCYDIVFFGASLQYFEDPIGVLDSWSVWSSSIIAIVDSPLSETKAFVTAQIDQGNRAIPSAIHNREELCEKFAEKGYDLIQKIFHSEHKEHFNNFDLPYSSAGYWTLIFRKRAA